MSLYVEIGLASEDEVDTDAELARVLADLKRVGLVDEHQLVSWHSVVMDPAYVHITKASRKTVEEARRQLSPRGVFTIGRYGGWTYCSIEDNILEARELAELLAPFV
jgi:protoporphyrinogen oxidase